MHDPQRCSCWSTTAPSSGGAGRTRGRAGGPAPTRRCGRDRCAGACVRRAPRPPPARRRATSSAGTRRAADHRPAPPRRACGDGCREPARSPWLHLYRLGATSSRSSAPVRGVVAGAAPSVRLSATVSTSRACYENSSLRNENSPRADAGNFRLTARRARSYCRRCRFAAAPTPDLPPGGLGTGARAAGHAESLRGCACTSRRRTARAPARACRR